MDLLAHYRSLDIFANKTDEEIVRNIIEQIRRQILVHSYLYYELDNSIISDQTWSKWAFELDKLQKTYPKIAEVCVFAKEFKDFDPSSGYYLDTRNEWIQKKAQELLIARDKKTHNVIDELKESSDRPPFLWPHQKKAADRIKNGCILNGGTGSGKSRTGLYYYFCNVCGGFIDNRRYFEPEMKIPLYIITTAMKRDLMEWEEELSHYMLSPEKDPIVIDSWNNIQKYIDISGAFFLFDEDRVTGNGAWVKAFLKIANKNQWIILSATPGDNWSQYIPVFIANGFYKNKTEFANRHCIYDPHVTKFPKIVGYRNKGYLMKCRNDILIDMDSEDKNAQHHIDITVSYDKEKYKQAMKTRWDPYKDIPMTQAADLCRVCRHIVNEDGSRQRAFLELVKAHEKVIVFYSFDYELDILRGLTYPEGTVISEWNGHKHEAIPDAERWVYLVNYGAGAEGWNSIETDTMIFYSQSYSYKTMVQAAGRIDRANTTFHDLYYYHLKSKASIDLAISKALLEKRDFNENRWNW